jgi:hypothetical protein
MSIATLIHEWNKSDSGSAGITIEPHDKNLGGGWAHTFRVFTKDNLTAQVTLKVSKGTLQAHLTESVVCDSDISFSDSDIAETDRYITGLISVDADLFINENYEFTTANLTLQSGKIKASKKITGNASIKYYAKALVYSYFPYARFPNVREYGRVLAAQKDLKTFATYDPMNNITEKSRDTIILVFREIVATSQDKSPFELPSNWPEGNDYNGITEVLVDEIPEVGTGSVVQLPMDSYFFENGTYYRDLPAYFWHYPSPVDEWDNAVIHIKKNYNADNYGAANVSIFDGLVAGLEIEYSARFNTVIVE